jgi:hypothetical protein
MDKKDKEATATDFDGATADDTVTDTDNDELSATRASIESWFGTNVFGLKADSK